MNYVRVLLAAALPVSVAACGDDASKSQAQPMSVEEFRRELVGMPLCGMAKSGEFAGKLTCTVHLVDGTAIVAG